MHDTPPVPANDLGLERSNQPFHPIIVADERIFQHDRSLRLIIQFQVHPIDGVITTTLLGALYECAP